MFNKLKILTKMKIKNMKLMLLGLLATMSMNAFAAETADEADRSVNGIKYRLKTTYKSDGKTVDSRTATVIAVNTEATADQKKTIVVPATVKGDNNVEYKVTGFASSTWGANAADKCTSLTINVDNFPAALTSDAFGGFTKLENLVINDGGSLGKTTEFPGGFSDKAKATLKSVDFTNSKIKKIAANAFEGCTALTSCPLTGIEVIGANAFDGCCGISELTIPATVKEIGDNAFANMYKSETKDGKTVKSGLQTLTFNANDAFTAIPAAFENDKLLKSVTITSAKAKSITDGAFAGANGLKNLDLSGMTALENNIGGVFAASKRFTTVKLAGTKLKTVDLDLSNSNRTLKTITFPDAVTEIPGFMNFIALTSVDLSNTKVTVIPDYEFAYVEGDNVAKLNDKGEPVVVAGKTQYEEPQLASVTLNAKTTKIGALAFYQQKNLATVANMNQGELTEIGNSAFYGTDLSALELSGATKLATIGSYAFAENSNLATVALPASITSLGTAAFAYDNQIASINLGDLTKLATLPLLFQEVVYNPYGAAEPDKAHMDKLTTLTLPMNGKLTTIDPGAFQFLGIEEIVIPSTVTSFGNYKAGYSGGVLQGCINLKKFTWEGAKQNSLSWNTFRGDDKLETVIFATVEPIPDTGNIFDELFLGNDKDKLTVYVTAESYELLEANGWSEANAKYATLAKIGPAEYDFTEKALAADGYYYRTYVNENSGTWFNADEVEVFGAVVEGANVILKPAQVENGYYKVSPYYYESEEEIYNSETGSWEWVTVTRTQPWAALCVIRSKTQKVTVEYKDAGWNQMPTLKENDLTMVTAKDGMQVSRLKYIYKLGRKDEQVKFWRCTSGKLNKGVIYLESHGAKDLEFMDMIVEGEATAIKGFQADAQDANAPIYNLQGVRVNKAQKGVYIQNGKKFIMK